MELKRTDSEYIERFEHFAFDEVVNEKALKKRCHTRHGKKIACRATDYLGYGRALKR